MGLDKKLFFSTLQRREFSFTIRNLHAILSIITFTGVGITAKCSTLLKLINWCLTSTLTVFLLYRGV
jgi:uncharacterized membrane protein